jgi:3D-(3,5/4)-trihydroxycyclohexane-1,2-dione acylhydrolase (decyclizing)
MMAVTSSIGPGATNMVTAAAVARVNRLPLLLLPGDVFANRRPDPVLQQIENFADGTVSANDCFRPVSRYFDRITRPEQIITALQRAMAVLTDPTECGPVTLALCQDVQAEAFDYPEVFFAERIWTPRRVRPSEDELSAAIAKFRQARKPLIIAGGGVLYSGATATLKQFAEAHRIPLAETQAGKSSLPADHPLNMGAIGVNGSSAANILAEQADVVLAVGTRLQDFTTGSWALFQNDRKAIIGLNTQLFDATKLCPSPHWRRRYRLEDDRRWRWHLSGAGRLGETRYRQPRKMARRCRARDGCDQHRTSLRGPGDRCHEPYRRSRRHRGLCRRRAPG